MDTKWKNIKSKAKSFLEKCWLSSTGIAVKLFCFVLAGFGIAFWYSVVVYRTYHPTGESLFFGILGNALFGAGQMILTAFLIMRKFREWDPGEKDAYVSRSDQLRVDLITNVSHDLKTPLTSMVGYIELIKREELSDIVRDYVDVISERAEKLKEMINSLFNLAKASSGNVELHPEPFEVNRMIEQIFADMDDRIKESHLEFVTDLTKEDTQLISDNSYFYRICQNLIENALKYSAKGTRVFVKTKLLQSEGKEEVWLEVTNTSGYPMDFTKEDIIERFARGDKARTGDGNGLGLAIVSTYAKALGGEFDILIDCDQFKACLKFPKKTT